jgi:hypothetical protein
MSDTKVKTPKTADERRAEADSLHDSIGTRLEELTSTEGWARFLAFATGFHSFSLSNVLLILSQRPDASRVAGLVDDTEAAIALEQLGWPVGGNAPRPGLAKRAAGDLSSRMDEEGEVASGASSPMHERFGGHRLQPESPVFGTVSDRDLITLADLLCRSLEFHSMLVAAKVMGEIGVRGLWPAVIDRRSRSIRLSAPDASEEDSRRVASKQLQRFRDENFPVEPEQFDDDPNEAAKRRNAYIAF